MRRTDRQHGQRTRSTAPTRHTIITQPSTRLDDDLRQSILGVQESSMIIETLAHQPITGLHFVD